MRHVLVIATALVMIAAGVANAQEQVTPSLAEVARQAEAAKANVKKAKKTYTNFNLSADSRGDRPASAAPPATAPLAPLASVASGKPAPPAVAVSAPADANATAGPATESEDVWRSRGAAVRTQVDRLRARLAELTTPNKLKDENPGLKAANDIEIANTRTALDVLKKQWARLEASANEQKVPLAWIQPAPEFPQ